MWHLAQAIVAVDHSACILKWAPVGADDLDGYNVYMRAGHTAEFEKMNPEPLTGNEWISPALRLDTKYFFRITAIDNSDNESLPGTIIPFTLRGATEDMTLVYLQPPTPHLVRAGESIEESIPANSIGILTRFEIGGFI